MDLIVGGMPRGGTTVAAKLASLHPSIFCYASETHIIPFLYSCFSSFPCHENKIDLVCTALRQQTTSALIDMPRFSVSRGAHPGNLIFNESDVDHLVNSVRKLIAAGRFGIELYLGAVGVLRDLIFSRVSREIIGEKTPDNLFAMAEYDVPNLLKVVVVREVIGVVKSMRKRANDNDDQYASAFRGDLETNLGMYMDYAEAAGACARGRGALIVRYEDLALDPGSVVKRIYESFSLQADERILAFVEGKRDKEIADRAPMNYRRLTMTPNLGDLSGSDYWKAMRITQSARTALGYDDVEMQKLGYPKIGDWPGLEVPPIVLPMSGFHAPEPGGRWMKKSGLLIAYCPDDSHHVDIQLWSSMPPSLKELISGMLTIEVNNVVLHEVPVEVGPQLVHISIPISDSLTTRIGANSSFMLVRLRSPVSYVPIATEQDGGDWRQISFMLVSAVVV